MIFLGSVTVGTVIRHCKDGPFYKNQSIDRVVLWCKTSFRRPIVEKIFTFSAVLRSMLDVYITIHPFVQYDCHIVQ